jgi:hypothetical protein
VNRLHRLTRLLALVSATCAATLVLTCLPAQAMPLEDYAAYRPQTNCSPWAKPGTKTLGHWLVDHRGGGFGPISRPCSSAGVSEHKEGRAFDWVLDATKERQRLRATRFLEFAFKANAAGDEDVWARRMGIMYIIWNDHIYSAYDGFEKRDYLSSSCKTRRACSTTLRHRDHMHISLSRAGGRGETSFYLTRQ